MVYDVIHLVRIFYPNVGGMEKFVYELATRQANSGLRVLVVTSNVLKDGTVHNHKYDVPFDVCNIDSFVFRGFILPNFRSLFYNFESCINLHIHGMDPFVDFFSLKIKKRATFITAHGGFFHTPSFQFLKKVYFRTITALLARFSKSEFLCVSDNDMDLVKHLSNKVWYVGCGANEFKKSFSDSGVVCFGRVAPNKNINGVIRFVLSNLPDQDFVIVGDNLDKVDMLDGNYVHLTGVDDDTLSKVVSSSRYFVSLSFYEGLGISLIEALKSELICIVSDIDSYRNIDSRIRASCDGLSSIIFVSDIKSTSDLTRAINSISRESLERVSLAASNIWNWDTVNNKVESYYVKY